MALLYIAQKKNDDLRDKIAQSVSGFGHKFTDIIESRIALAGIEGIVLVGLQRFHQPDDYFNFLDYVHDHNRKVVGVLNMPQRLPNDNQGIDHVIEFLYGQKRIGTIGKEISGYFSQLR